MGVLADLADELKYDRERQLQFGAFRASTPPRPAVCVKIWESGNPEIWES